MLEAPHRRQRAGPRVLEQARRRRLRDRVDRRPCPRLARPLGDRDGVAGRLPASGRRSAAGRTRTSATCSACRPTTARPPARPRGVPRVRPLPRRGRCASSRSPARRRARVVQPDLDYIEEAWNASPGGLIFALGHVGNNEAVAAAVAGRGWPVNVVADDSSFPRCSSGSGASARGGASTSSRGATCARSTRCSAGGRCSPC